MGHPGASAQVGVKDGLVLAAHHRVGRILDGDRVFRVHRVAIAVGALDRRRPIDQTSHRTLSLVNPLMSQPQISTAPAESSSSRLGMESNNSSNAMREVCWAWYAPAQTCSRAESQVWNDGPM